MIIALIPTNGREIAQTIESCRRLNIKTCVVYNNTESQNIDVDIELFSNANNLSGALNDGLKEIYASETYHSVVRVDAGWEVERLPKVVDSDFFYFSFRKSSNLINILLSKLFKKPVLLMFDNVFSHSGLIIPTKYRMYYDVGLNRAQDFGLYLDVWFSRPFKLTPPLCKKVVVDKSSASYLDRRGQLNSSIQSIRIHSRSLGLILSSLMILFRSIKLVVK